MRLQGSQGHILNGGEARCRYRGHHDLLRRVLLGAWNQELESRTIRQMALTLNTVSRHGENSLLTRLRKPLHSRANQVPSNTTPTWVSSLPFAAKLIVV